MRVIHAAHSGTHAFAARSIESGEQAVIVTTPYPPSDLFAGLCGAPTRRGHPCTQPAKCRWHPKAKS
jgi:hypothetical protein